MIAILRKSRQKVCILKGKCVLLQPKYKQSRQIANENEKDVQCMVVALLRIPMIVRVQAACRDKQHREARRESRRVSFSYRKKLT